MLLNRGPNGLGVSPIASGVFTDIGSADAANGVYILNGSAVTLEDIIDLTNPNTNFDPDTDIDGGGLMPHSGGQNDSPYLKEPLLSQVLTGFTATLEFVTSADMLGTVINISLASDDFGINPAVGISWSESTPTDLIAIYDKDFNEYDTNGLLQTTGIHKLAVTFDGSHIAFSADGGEVVSQAVAGTDPLLSMVFFNVGGASDSRLRSFAFYDIVDDADLPSLSTL